MSEYRRDPILGQWVIVHTDASRPPEKYEKQDNSIKHRKTCQFCPGREYLTTPELIAIRSNGSQANQTGWQARVIPNKFPALKIEGDINQHFEGMFELSNGVGAHEVIIETSDHDRQLSDLSVDEFQGVLHLYQQRVLDLQGDKRFKYVIIFKNHGASAGTSVEHSHSQIIALPMVPKYVAEELRGTRQYFEHHEQCIYCDILVQERQEQTRVVCENDHFAVICPFVSRYPFECWVLPKRHDSQFVHVKDDEKFALAQILSEALVRIKKCLSDPSYNFYFHIAPVNEDTPNHYHWHIEIIPKIANPSGFESGTGFYVVRTSPEDAAKYLRAVSV